MAYEFTIVRLKKNGSKNLSFPVSLDREEKCPIAGPFDAVQRAVLLASMRRFPFVRRSDSVRDCFEIDAPGGGRLDAWMTSDGHLFLESQAGLELTLALFRKLRTVMTDIAIEDTQTGELHDSTSFGRILSSYEPVEIFAA